MEHTEKYTMKELPEEERPYERMTRYGASALSDAELLAILLRNGRAGESALELSRRLLRECTPREGAGALSVLFALSVQELTRFPGIGRVKALQLTAAAEIARRLSIRTAGSVSVITSASDLAQKYIPLMRDLQKEEIYGIWLDNRLRILGETQLSVGSVNQALLSTREIFLEAVKHKAVHFILIHNHPRGDPTPSAADIHGTRKLTESGKLLEIKLLDHIVIGDGVFFSMKEEGLL